MLFVVVCIEFVVSLSFVRSRNAFFNMYGGLFGHNFCRFGLFFMAKIKIFKIQEPFSPVFFQKNYVKMQILLFLLLVCSRF